MNKSEAAYVLEEIDKLFPNAGCELDYRTHFELLIAIVLSAQTTDKRVNIVTKDLFKKYGSASLLAKADFVDVKNLISSIGLANNKAKNIIALSNDIIDKFDGEVPNTFDELISLPGVGRKTANVMLVEAFKIPAIPVDTHVERVSKRLGFAPNNADVLIVEEKLSKYIDKDKWIKAHHLFIHFGRYFCKASAPSCSVCPLYDKCKYKKKKDGK